MKEEEDNHTTPKLSENSKEIIGKEVRKLCENFIIKFCNLSEKDYNPENLPSYYERNISLKQKTKQLKQEMENIDKNNDFLYNSLLSINENVFNLEKQVLSLESEYKKIQSKTDEEVKKIIDKEREKEMRGLLNINNLNSNNHNIKQVKEKEKEREETLLIYLRN